ncbi:MAG: pantetheine-phosphate adenylyltransferase [Pseudomonadota bacterium]|nr:pantetheine-phosphate adenylyltransferase [Pseudomonadota bacterium]
MNRAVFAGTFDPFTNGHKDIALRGAKLFDELVIFVPLQSGKKTPLFTPEERIALIEDTFPDMANISVQAFDGLLVDEVRKVGAKHIVRGLRATSDFEFEFNMVQFNTELAPDIETVFLMSRADQLHYASSSIKEIAIHGGDVSRYLPAHIEEALECKLIAKRFGH